MGRRFGVVRLVYQADRIVLQRMSLKFGVDEVLLYKQVNFENNVFMIRRVSSKPVVSYKGNTRILLLILDSSQRQVQRITINQVAFAINGPMSYYTGLDSKRVIRELVNQQLYYTSIYYRLLPSLKELYVIWYIEDILFKLQLQREYQNLYNIEAYTIKQFLGRY